MTHHLDIDTLTLKYGGHDSADDGMCVMEAVAYFAGEKHSDHPACVSPVIGAFLRRWNDDLEPTKVSLQESARQLLDRLIAVGSEVPA